MGGGSKVGASVHVEAESVGHAGDPHYQPRLLAVGYRHPPQVRPHSTHPHLTNGDRPIHFSPSHPCHTELQINLHLHTPLRASWRGLHSYLAYSISLYVGWHGGVVGISRDTGIWDEVEVAPSLSVNFVAERVPVAAWDGHCELRICNNRVIQPWTYSWSCRGEERYCVNSIR